MSCSSVYFYSSVDESESLSGRLQELKNKGKEQLVNPKGGRGRLRERSRGLAYENFLITRFEWQCNGGRKETFDCISLDSKQVFSFRKSEKLENRYGLWDATDHD